MATKLSLAATATGGEGMLRGRANERTRAASDIVKKVLRGRLLRRPTANKTKPAPAEKIELNTMTSSTPRGDSSGGGNWFGNSSG